MRARHTVLILVVAIMCGCAARSDHIAEGQHDVIFLVPGVAGPSRAYQRVIDGLHAGGVDRPVRVIAWGAPPLLFFMNFQTESIHRRAEAELAKMISDWRKQHPAAQIDLIGHSAGGGVILGALKQLDVAVRVRAVVLLAPSVSPTYDLAPALARVDDRIHNFHSDRDTFFLSWRTGTFGSYDNVKTRAAGNRGFGLAKLQPSLASRMVQHAYDPRWRDVGNDGGHFGTVAYDFARVVIAPLLLSPSSAPPSRSSAATRP